MKVFLATTLCAAATVLGVANAQDGSATYPTETGDLTVTYGQPAARDYGTRPEFSALDSDSSGSIDLSEARSYALLDVDFDHADGNGNGSISAREFAAWPRNR